MHLTRLVGVGPWYVSIHLLYQGQDSHHFNQVSKVQYDRVWGYIESGKTEGAKVLLGGTKRGGKGYYVEPTSTLFSCGDSDLDSISNPVQSLQTFGPI